MSNGFRYLYNEGSQQISHFDTPYTDRAIYRLDEESYKSALLKALSRADDSGRFRSQNFKFQILRIVYVNPENFDSKQLCWRDYIRLGKPIAVHLSLNFIASKVKTYARNPSSPTLVGGRFERDNKRMEKRSQRN